MDSPNQLNDREIVEAKTKAGIEIPGVVNSVHWKAPLSHPDPKVRAQCVESMKTAIKSCRLYWRNHSALSPWGSQ